MHPLYTIYNITNHLQWLEFHGGHINMHRIQQIRRSKRRWKLKRRGLA